VGTRQEGQPDGVGVFLQHGLGDLLRSLMEPGVDDFEAVVTERSGDRLGAAVVPIEAWLGDHDSIRALHEG
jgi:hypothetical protein